MELFLVGCVLLWIVIADIIKRIQSKKHAKKYAILKENLEQYSDIEQILNDNKYYLNFKNISIDYEVYPLQYYRRISPEEEINILQKNIQKRDEFYNKYVFSTCKHGIQFANISSARCELCLAEFIKWEIAIEEKERKEKEWKKLQKKIATLHKYQNKLKYGKMTNEEIGAAYERYIGYRLETLGYEVEYNGIRQGKKDGGVDLFAMGEDVTYLVQCKWYKESSKIHINTFHQLLGTLQDFKIQNPKKKFVALLYTAYDNIDDKVKRSIEYHADIYHRAIEMDYDYPMIKCNIGKHNEKIYHMPGRGMYDYIKINTKKGEKYVHTIEEAENLGFRMSQ